MQLYRVTSEQDGGLVPRMYSYWPNAFVNGSTAVVFVGHEDGHPRFFRVNLDTGDVTRLGSPLPYTGTAEGWYWDAAGTIYLIEGPRLRRVSPFAPSDIIVFDLTDEIGGCDLWQAHSSDEGQTHSATVRRVVDQGAYPTIGTVVFRAGQGQQFFEALDYALDESALTSDGAYLIIKSSPDDDNLVITLATGEQRWLRKSEGALGHSDCGPSYMVGADRDHEPRACVKWDLTRPLTMENRILLAQSADWSGGDLGHVSIKNGRCIVSDGTSINLVGLNGEGVTKLLDHGMVGNDYDHQVKANLDPTGQIACFMSNMGGGRQDVYLVRI